MAQATFSQNVSTEEITFSDEAKEALRKGKISGGNDARVEDLGKDSERFWRLVTVNNHAQIAYEGDHIVSYPDGRQELVSGDLAKANITVSKSKSTSKPPSTKEAMKAAEEDSKTLAERAAENGNDLNSQNNSEQKFIAEVNKPEAVAAQESKK